MHRHSIESTYLEPWACHHAEYSPQILPALYYLAKSGLRHGELKYGGHVFAAVKMQSRCSSIHFHQRSLIVVAAANVFENLRCCQFTAFLGKLLADQASGGSISSLSLEMMMAMDRKKR
jgi:hypothetical protein